MRWLRSRGTAAVLILCLLSKALLGTLAVASAAADVGAKSGTVLVPICAGGVITYVEMALGGVAEAPEPDDRAPSSTPVVGEACAVFGAFVVPRPEAAGIVAASLITTAPLAWQPHTDLVIRALPHPPLRGPPLPF